MHFEFGSDQTSLAERLRRFVQLVGEKRWSKRADQLDSDQRSSPYLWKIVSDYHWLEMAISHQYAVLRTEGRLVRAHIDPPALSALHFAGAVVEIHARLSKAGQRQLEGRLRDGLNAGSGFAPLYLEVDLALRLMGEGYDVRFADMEREANFDFEFARDGFSGEVECKSLSADAGRRIHRKDFYRFIDALGDDLNRHAMLNRQECLVITLKDRLRSNLLEQSELRRGVAHLLREDAPLEFLSSTFRIERRPCIDSLGPISANDAHTLEAACQRVFGLSSHVAGGMGETWGCIVVMRSEREDDTSAPWLDAMRQAAKQFSGTQPGFIVIQFQDLATPDLMSLHLRRRAGLLSHALFGHHGARHVNATYVCGYAATTRGGAPAFAIPNPNPRYIMNPEDASIFFSHIPDADYAAAIGAPMPAENISRIRF